MQILDKIIKFLFKKTLNKIIKNIKLGYWNDDYLA